MAKQDKSKKQVSKDFNNRSKGFPSDVQRWHEMKREGFRNARRWVANKLRFRRK